VGERRQRGGETPGLQVGQSNNIQSFEVPERKGASFRSAEVAGEPDGGKRETREIYMERGNELNSYGGGE